MPPATNADDAVSGVSPDSAGPGPAGPGLVGPGRVAVVTGAASGIGLGLCERFAAAGMSVVMADVEEAALDRAAVGALRDAALSAFGPVHVVCNNAGVGGSHGPPWEMPPGEWDWVLGVNLEGVTGCPSTRLPR